MVVLAAALHVQSSSLNAVGTACFEQSLTHFGMVKYVFVDFCCLPQRVYGDDDAPLLFSNYDGNKAWMPT